MQGPPYDPRFVPPPAGSYGQPLRRDPPASSEAIAAIILACSAWMCFHVLSPGLRRDLAGLARPPAVRRESDTVGGDQLGLVAMIVGGVLAGLQTLIWVGYAAMIAYFALMHKP